MFIFRLVGHVPIVIVIAAAPVFGLYPLLVIWGGLTFVPKAILIFAVAAFPIMNTIMMHARRTPAPDPQSPDAAKVRAARQAPGSVVAMMAGLRLGIVMGVTALILTEFTAASRGAAK